MRFGILWLLVILLVTGCARTEERAWSADKGSGCQARWQWCYNCKIMCLDVEKGESHTDETEEQGEPGVGIKIMNAK